MPHWLFYVLRFRQFMARPVRYGFYFCRLRCFRQSKFKTFQNTPKFDSDDMLLYTLPEREPSATSLTLSHTYFNYWSICLWVESIDSFFLTCSKYANNHYPLFGVWLINDLPLYLRWLGLKHPSFNLFARGQWDCSINADFDNGSGASSSEDEDGEMHSAGL